MTITYFKFQVSGSKGGYFTFSSSHAVCAARVAKITTMGQQVSGSPNVYVRILQTGTTNTYWQVYMPLTSPLVQSFSAVMAGGLTVTVQGDAATCPAPVTSTLGTIVAAGNVIYFKFEKGVPKMPRGILGASIA